MGFFTHFLTALNNDAMNIHVKVLCEHMFSFLLSVPRSGIDESYGNSVFNLLRNSQSVL
jgi:hypothetical protein